MLAELLHRDRATGLPDEQTLLFYYPAADALPKEDREQYYELLKSTDSRPVCLRDVLCCFREGKYDNDPSQFRADLTVMYENCLNFVEVSAP